MHCIKFLSSTPMCATSWRMRLLYLPLWLHLGGTLWIMGRLVQLALQGPFVGYEGYYRHILGFTVLQAFLAAVCTTSIAFWIAWIVRRSTLRHHWVRILYQLWRVPTYLPSLVGCMALVHVWGQSGLIAHGFHQLSWPYTNPLYGLSGILCVHLFFYLPPLIHTFYHHLNALVPNHYARLASSLGIPHSTYMRYIVWPLVRTTVRQNLGWVAVSTSNAFTTILCFGGLPRYTTTSVALLQALRQGSLLHVAAQLALCQLLLQALALWLMQPTRRPFMCGSLQAVPSLPVTQPLRGHHWAVLFILSLLLVPPLGSVLYHGLRWCPWKALLHDLQGYKCILNSLMLALGSSLVSFIWSAYHVGYRHVKRHEYLRYWIDISAHLPLLLSPFALSVCSHSWDSTPLNRTSALLIVSLAQAWHCLPSMYRILYPPYAVQQEQQQRLCVLLGIQGWARWKHIVWPWLKASISHAVAIPLVIAISSIRIPLFFAPEHLLNLGQWLYDKMQGYAFGEAEAISLLLCGIHYTIFYTLQRKAISRD